MNLGKILRTIFIEEPSEERPVLVPDWPSARREEATGEVVPDSDVCSYEALEEGTTCSASRR